MTTASPALEALDLSSRSYATCLSWSSDHFRTFDGMDFSFEGACTYTLAAGTDGTWDATLKRDNCDTLDTCYKVSMEINITKLAFKEPLFQRLHSARMIVSNTNNKSETKIASPAVS